MPQGACRAFLLGQSMHTGSSADVVKGGSPGLAEPLSHGLPLWLLLSQEECFTSPSGTAFECKFWADSPFSISICPATGPFPQHTCH